MVGVRVLSKRVLCLASCDAAASSAGQHYYYRGPAKVACQFGKHIGIRLQRDEVFRLYSRSGEHSLRLPYQQQRESHLCHSGPRVLP